MPEISAEQVRTEVKKFWNCIIRKSQEELEAMYFPHATVFASTVPRTESARLTIMRRARQFFAPKSSVRTDVGPVEVQLIGDIAIASYSYSFYGTEVKSDGALVDHDVPSGRATHIFQLDEHGKLRILHEHLSSCEPAKAGATVEI